MGNGIPWLELHCGRIYQAEEGYEFQAEEVEIITVMQIVDWIEVRFLVLKGTNFVGETLKWGKDINDTVYTRKMKFKEVGSGFDYDGVVDVQK